MTSAVVHITTASSSPEKNIITSTSPILKCKYCLGPSHTRRNCIHLTVEHDSANCEICRKKNKRFNRKSTNKKKANTKEDKTSTFYSSKEYWEQRYERLIEPNDRNEWFVSYKEHLKPLFEKYLPKSTTNNPLNILDIGCGASLLVESLVFDGYGSVTGVDIANSAIELMNQRIVNMEMKFQPLIKYIHVRIFKIIIIWMNSSNKLLYTTY